MHMLGASLPYIVDIDRGNVMICDVEHRCAVYRVPMSHLKTSVPARLAGSPDPTSSHQRNHRAEEGAQLQSTTHSTADSDTHTQLTMAAAGPSNGSMGVAPPRRPAKRMAAGSTPDMTMTGMSPRVPATNSALQLSTFEVSLSPLLRPRPTDWDRV